MMKTKPNITIGIDEVGRGPLAGPLVVCALALDDNHIPEGLDDSKRLTPSRRKNLVVPIKQSACGIGIAWIKADLIDELGMTRALRRAAKLALAQLPKDILAMANTIYTDGNISFVDDEREITLPKADAKIKAVSAASIIAKTTRDQYMVKLSKIYTQYGFNKHMGYGTPDHLAALEKYGYIPGIHRQSFSRVSELVPSSFNKVAKMTKSRALAATAGYQAESLAAEYLTSQGYNVLTRNWRVKWCEIDLVATKEGQYYFVEVKYRQDATHGDGVAAITPQKLDQMKRAALIYLHYFNMDTAVQPNLLVVSVSGSPMQIDRLVPITI